MITVGTDRFLAGALRQMLGDGQAGDIAFATFLPSDDLDSLCANPNFSVPGWKIYGVVDRNEGGIRCITADRAVELRESKQEPLLLLIDRGRAGAGLDGIYSASREI